MRSKVIAGLIAGINAANLGITAYPEVGGDEIDLPALIVRMATDNAIDGMDGCGVRDTTIEVVCMVAGTHAEADATAASALNTAVLDYLDGSGESDIASQNVTVSAWMHDGTDYAPEGSRWQWTQRWRLIVCDNLDGD